MVTMTMMVVVLHDANGGDGALATMVVTNVV
jgi:hypothetical protein